MATTNWKMSEIYGVLKSGKIEDVQDLARRFPLTALAVASGDLEKVLSGIPDYITVRKVESVLKGDVQADEDGTEDVEIIDEDEEAMKPVDEPTEVAEVVEKPKGKRGRKPKAQPVEPQPVIAVEEEAESEVAEEAESEDKYANLNAIELFKLCKKRGIKVESKKKADVYIKLLKEADEAEALAEEAEDDDDWDDIEEAEEKPVEKPKKAETKKAKPVKEAEPEDEDDDSDWDI